MTSANFPTRVLYWGENLHFLRGMNSGTVDLIATDPPFNKNRDFDSTTPDSLKGGKFEDRWKWDKDVHPEWQDQLKETQPDLMEAIEAIKRARDHGMAAFICYLSVRILEMRRILKDTGSIYLHCDPTASHYIKMCMDAIFGRKNFQNEIVWRRTLSPKSSVKRLGASHDIVFFYTKNIKKSVWNMPRIGGYGKENPLPHYKKGADGRYFTTTVITASPGMKKGNPKYEYKGYIPPHGWLHSLKNLIKLDEEGRVVWSKNGVPRKKIYWEESLGKPCDDIWTDIKVLASNDKQRTKYPTQKPLALYERIISASSNEGDIVLDPFCGCATTLVAAQKLRRKWVGIDKWEGAEKEINTRLADVGITIENAPSEGTIPFIKVRKEIAPPKRTDGKETASGYLETIEKRGKELVMNYDKMMSWLLDLVRKECGGKLLCPGCGTEFHNEKHFQLDHGRPKSESGNHLVGNRMPLCWRCNQTKSDTKTMTALIAYNKNHGLFPPSADDSVQFAEYLKRISGNLTRLAESKERDEIMKYALGKECDLFRGTIQS